jgi:GTP cyclohydrolase I
MTLYSTEPGEVDSVVLASAFLASIGVDVTSPDMERTPLRFTAALRELTAGLRDPVDAGQLLGRTFAPPPGVPVMIFLKKVPFRSVCEHHLLPFTGHATVAYLPAEGARVAGISKLARLVDGYAAAPQMQERLGQQVVDALAKHLDIQGAGCLIEAVHTCLTLRGPCAEGATMLTSHLTGKFFDGQVRAEFLALAAG